MFVLLLDFAEASENLVHVAGALGIFHGAMQRLQFVVQIARATAAGDGFVQYRAALHFLFVLAEISDRQPFWNRDIALIGSFLTNNHAEERGLSGAVGANQADLFAGVQLKGSVDKD